MKNILKKLLFLVFALFILIIPTRSYAEGEVCDVNNKEQCDQAEKAEIIGNQGEHTEQCDKTIYLFYGAECPNCQAEEKFLDDLVKNHPEIQVKRYEVWHNNENLELFKKMAGEKNVKAQAVPTTFVGHQTFVGYASDDLTGNELKKSIFDLYCIDEQVEEKSIKIPFLGKVAVSSLSVPTLTIVLGIIDGFNPCAMWALIALITILIATQDKKKIRLVGGIFIASSWLIYFLFMALYLNTFKLLSFVVWIRYLIGAVAVFAGVIYLKDFVTYQPGVCKVTSPKQQKSIMERMKKVASSNSLILLVIGVISLAFSVNLVEMMCSFGLPVIYTQILSMNHLPTWQYYLYLALYNTFYMADDIIVFTVAALTMNYVHLNNKYEKWMKLVGGVLIIALGVILILRPDLLNI